MADNFSLRCCVCRIMQAGSPRHTLVPRSGPITNAIAAFNPPKDALGAQTEGKGTKLTLNLTLTQHALTNLTVANFTLINLTNTQHTSKPYTN